MSRVLILAAAIALLVLAACGGPAARRPTGATSLQDLPDLARMQTLFNQDIGKTRLILLVAPT